MLYHILQEGRKRKKANKANPADLEEIFMNLNYEEKWEWAMWGDWIFVLGIGG
jgi:hypothetical protein